MISPSEEMLAELMVTLDPVGAGLDAMDWHELPLDPQKYQYLAGFCARMLSLVPKDHPGLSDLLNRYTALNDIWSNINLARVIGNNSPWTWDMREVILRAQHPELFRADSNDASLKQPPAPEAGLG